MSSNGPNWPEQPAGPPGRPSGPPPGPGAPVDGQPPQEPTPLGHYPPPGQPTQAVPNYAPPSQATQSAQHPPAHDPFAQPVNTNQLPPQGSGGGGQRALLAGVLGGLLTLALVTGIVLFVTADDGEPSADPEPVVGEVTTTETSTPPPSVDTRIGTSVGGIELLAGDCINYDNSITNITSFDVVSCGTPHLAEITAQAEHPDAGGGFPGVDELHVWGGERCRTSTSDFLGTDVLMTTLESTTLVPDFDEWSDGLYSVSCLLQSDGGARLIESLEGKGASYPRSTEVAVNRLRAGDCFVPQAPQTAFDLGVNDITSLTPCTGPHDGLFFGRAILDYGTGAAFPGQEAVDADAIELCNTEFTRYFGVTHEGLNYRFWSPDGPLWNQDDRTVHCAVLDEKGLPPTLDYADFRPMYELPIGQCFTFGPEETTDTMRLDDQAEPVDCAQQHNGELFGFGELPASDGGFPGSEAVDQQVADECITLFTDYVGISPFDSDSGDFIYWFPNETGWENNDLRWACALLTDDVRVGSIEGINA